MGWGLFLCACALYLLVTCFGDRRDGQWRSWRARTSSTCSLMGVALGAVLVVPRGWFLYGGALGRNGPTSCIGGFAFVASVLFLNVYSRDTFIFIFPDFLVVLWVSGSPFLHCALDDIVVVGGDNALVALGSSTMGLTWPCARLATVPVIWHVPLDTCGQETVCCIRRQAVWAWWHCRGRRRHHCWHARRPYQLGFNCSSRRA